MRVKLNYKGFVALRNSPEVVSDLTSRAQRIAQTAGDGFVVTEPRYNHSISGRASVRVVTGDAEAMVAQTRDNVLDRAMDAGRG